MHHIFQIKSVARSSDFRLAPAWRLHASTIRRWWGCSASTSLCRSKMWCSFAARRYRRSRAVPIQIIEMPSWIKFVIVHVWELNITSVNMAIGAHMMFMHVFELLYILRTMHTKCWHVTYTPVKFDRREEGIRANGGESPRRLCKWRSCQVVRYCHLRQCRERDWVQGLAGN